MNTDTAETSGVRTEESECEGARRVYTVHVPAGHLESLKTQRLEELGKTLRLPGFRPGKIPLNILEKRYGSKTRAEAANRLAAEAADRIFATGGLASAIEIVTGTDSGDLEFRVIVTHLPDLPPLDLTKLAIERLSASDDDIQAARLTADVASELFNDRLRQQVLDYLDAAYAFPVAAGLVEREFTAIRQVAESQLELESIAAELRIIAERRVRLGAVVAELARRFGIALTGAEMAQFRQPGETAAQTRARLAEDKVVERLIANARVTDRIVSSGELRELAEA
jgi:FKBP-type peptidyl-prolyl cis-trans isomerase (trigger factor)